VVNDRIADELAAVVHFGCPGAPTRVTSQEKNSTKRYPAHVFV